MPPTTSPPRTSPWRVRAAVAAAAVVAAGLIAGLVYLTVRRPHRTYNYLDQPIGVQVLPGIDEEGFLTEEVSQSTGESYRWTGGSARLVVPVGDRPPRALFVRLGLDVPRPGKLTIKANGQPLFNGPVPEPTEWAQTFDLPGLSPSRPVVIELLSDTHVPAQVKGNTDGRTLGVCLRSLILLSGTQEYTDVSLGVRTVPEVQETGFHNPERLGGQPCRWTDGAARLTVPLRDRRPRLLALTAEVPRPDGYRLRVTVNGQTLFEDTVKRKGDWSAELPLDGVDLGSQAVIDLVSSTFVPAEVERGSKDNRTLGVRLKRLVLVGEPAAEKQPGGGERR
jgi:hypothetical protein